MFRTKAAQISRINVGTVCRSGRPFHASAVAHETVKEKVSEAANDVNLKVGKGLASAIEKGEQLTEKAKKTFGSKAEEAEEKTKQTAELGKQKMNQAGAGARKAKEDFEAEVRK